MSNSTINYKKAQIALRKMSDRILAELETNAIRSRHCKEIVSQYTDNMYIKKMSFNNIPDENIEACVRTLENLYDRYYVNDKFSQSFEFVYTSSFIEKLFTDQCPPLKENVTLNKIYDYIGYLKDCLEKSPEVDYSCDYIIGKVVKQFCEI